MKFILFLLCLALPSLATSGISSSSLIKDFKCLRSKGYEYAILQGFRSVGRVDTNIVRNIKNARAAGMKRVDVSLFPCISCRMFDIENQALGLINAIKGQDYDMIWIDIQVYEWGSNFIANQKIIISLVNKLQELNQKVGIYTNKNNWESIVGPSWTGCSSLPLWYVTFDNIDNFSDFSPFGGWQSPEIKQYQGDVKVCGSTVGLNFYPHNTDSSEL